MSMTDKILRFICRSLGLIFTFLAAFLFIGCLFGFVLMGHVDNPADVYEQVRALGFAAFVCLLVSFAFHATAELVN